MHKVLPDIQRLEELRDRGMSHQEIADWIEKHEGVRVSRGSVASAFSRAGKTRERPRYKRHLPWRVKAEHQQDYDAKMLRVLGKRDGGETLTPDQEKRLTSWQRDLAAHGLVVAYDADTGFQHVPGWPVDGIPIRR